MGHDYYYHKRWRDMNTDTHGWNSTVEKVIQLTWLQRSL